MEKGLGFHAIRAVVFDLDGTLRYNHPDGLAHFIEYAVSLGVPEAPGKRAHTYRWAHAYWGGVESQAYEDSRAFGLDTDDFWHNYSYRQLKAFGASESQARALAKPVHTYMRETFTPENKVMPGVFELLPRLQEAGYVLGVLSNRRNSCEEELASLGLLKYFDFNLVAGQIGRWKPDPRIFDPVLAHTDVRPGEIVYVGDNLYVDVTGAENAGIHPVLIDREGIFPDAECMKIGSLLELENLLG